ncbi:hypothetical protein Ahy_A10g050333 [Arachis hypogaea]|uniref:Endonuclease/exonuclease/phosphatase domain-containing protein n=1 Tax=Arachis hypogaea TaxID=3818 RepID=A0A445B941_ARAHY|nr:hypothetical protein Ahy_A10g050333 [Arachis hypogaea]
MQNKSDTEEKKGINVPNLKKLKEKMLEGLAKLTMAEENDIEGGTGSPAERGSITPTKLQETKAQELNLTQNHKGTQEVEEPDRMIMGLEDIITGDSVETEEKGKQGKEENKEKGMSKHLKDSTNTMSTPTKVGTKMWKRQARQATAMTTRGKKNNMEVEIKETSQKWRATGFYGCPEQENKKLSLNLLNTLGKESDMAWMIFGDFNQIMGQHEKQGENLVTFSQVEGFREAIQTNDLLDLGFVGHSFTWTNGKGGESNIQERLDRAMATLAWKESYPKTVV